MSTSQKREQVGTIQGLQLIPSGALASIIDPKGAKFAYDQGVLRLLYASPPFPNQSSARKREVQIKGWTREKKEKLIRGEWE